MPKIVLVGMFTYPFCMADIDPQPYSWYIPKYLLVIPYYQSQLVNHYSLFSNPWVLAKWNKRIMCHKSHGLIYPTLAIALPGDPGSRCPGRATTLLRRGPLTCQTLAHEASALWRIWEMGENQPWLVDSWSTPMNNRLVNQPNFTDNYWEKVNILKPTR